MIEVIIRPEGNAGYVVLYRIKGYGGSPVELSRFASTPEGRREATMYKNGLIRGIRLAAVVLADMVVDPISKD